MSEDKTCIIDPLITLCKVALLYFMPPKTRLSFSNNMVHIQENTYFQWAERMKNGDSRIDLSNLNAPFYYAMRWYVIGGDDKVPMDNNTHESIKKIAHIAVKGLIRLQTNTYHEDLFIKLTLQYLINMISMALDDVWDESYCVIPIDMNSILVDKIKNSFEPNVVKSIAKMLSDADEIENSIENIKTLTDCVHNLLTIRDKDFSSMIQKINSHPLIN